MAKTTSTTKNQLKDSTSKRGRRIKAVLPGKFGFTFQEFESAMKGNVMAAKKLSGLAEDGRNMSKLAPTVVKGVKEIMEGTKAYNEAIAKILTTAGITAIDIDKAGIDTSMANLDYGHARTEMALDFTLAKKAENTRHTRYMQKTALKAYLDERMSSEDFRVKIQGIVNNPVLRQKLLDAQYNIQDIEHLFKYGHSADLSLLPRKQYHIAAASATATPVGFLKSWVQGAVNFVMGK